MQYQYRKMFGLSWEEFKSEPISIWHVNILIDSILKRQKRGNKSKV